MQKIIAVGPRVAITRYSSADPAVWAGRGTRPLMSWDKPDVTLLPQCSVRKVGKLTWHNVVAGMRKGNDGTLIRVWLEYAGLEQFACWKTLAKKLNWQERAGSSFKKILTF